MTHKQTKLLLAFAAGLSVLGLAQDFHDPRAYIGAVVAFITGYASPHRDGSTKATDKVQ